jgi:hypothetical protein
VTAKVPDAELWERIRAALLEIAEKYLKTVSDTGNMEDET